MFTPPSCFLRVHSQHLRPLYSFLIRFLAPFWPLFTAILPQVCSLIMEQATSQVVGRQSAGNGGHIRSHKTNRGENSLRQKYYGYYCKVATLQAKPG